MKVVVEDIGHKQVQGKKIILHEITEIILEIIIETEVMVVETSF